eukprot:TRINITY_DN174_c0_g1_i3.p1 TRINITY_DN174_c0_g1~~TRINITY_DN174_c0_g1_i3.p1  ORF type:complete len:412 (-),score=49.50 TRINITY_DN174_c0_g1_i3:526-1761(-)
MQQPPQAMSTMAALGEAPRPIAGASVDAFYGFAPNYFPSYWFPQAPYRYTPVQPQMDSFSAPQRFIVPSRTQPPQPQQQFHTLPNSILKSKDSSDAPSSDPNEQKHTAPYQFSPIPAATVPSLSSPVPITQSSSATSTKQSFSVQSIAHSLPESPSTAPLSPASSPSSDSSTPLPSLPPMHLPFHTSHFSSEFSVGANGDITQFMLARVSSTHVDYETAALLSGLSTAILSRTDAFSIQRSALPPAAHRPVSQHIQTLYDPYFHSHGSSTLSTSRDSDDSSVSRSASTKKQQQSPTQRGVAKPRENHACPNCGVTDSTLWRNCTIRGKVQYLCNACGLRFKKGKYCAMCFKVYYDADTTSREWRQCNTCCNWSHKSCLEAHPRYAKFLDDSVPYTCGICTHDDHLDDEMQN